MQVVTISMHDLFSGCSGRIARAAAVPDFASVLGFAVGSGAGAESLVLHPALKKVSATVSASKVATGVEGMHFSLMVERGSFKQ
jgi:hypothetical protein